MADRLQGALQESVLTLLCLHPDYCAVIRNTIAPELFGNAVFRDIASHAADYIDSFQRPPGDHLPDLLEHILTGDDARKAKAYSDVLENLYAAEDGINPAYVMTRLAEFARLQSMKGGLSEAVELVQQGELDEAEQVITDAMQSRANLFDPGVHFSDVDRLVKATQATTERWPTGIEALDRFAVGPARKELHLFMAPPKRGKTWWLTHIGKTALIHKLRVLHITLEVSEDIMALRYLQCLFSWGRRKVQVDVPTLTTNDHGMLMSLGTPLRLDDRPHLDSDDAPKMIRERVGKLLQSGNLVIKEFPTGSLTINQLEAYLDALERVEKFSPDIVLLDYPDLMKINADQLRIDTGVMYKNLRGIAVRRNLAMCVVTQGSRASADARVVTDTHVAEDYSKIHTADVVVTYSQRPEERRLNLARLFVSNARNDDDKFSVVITQAYGLGQFALGSAHMPTRYWEMMDGDDGDREERD